MKGLLQNWRIWEPALIQKEAALKPERALCHHRTGQMARKEKIWAWSTARGNSELPELPSADPAAAERDAKRHLGTRIVCWSLYSFTNKSTFTPEHTSRIGHQGKYVHSLDVVPSDWNSTKISKQNNENLLYWTSFKAINVQEIRQRMTHRQIWEMKTSSLGLCCFCP